VIFFDNRTGGSATIRTLASATTVFEGFSSGGNARLITDAGGLVDFSLSSGPSGDGRLTVGSIEGPGIYDLGSDQLIVGGNGRPSTASGPIDDGGFGGSSGASLVKVGKGTLTLSSGDNTYSGGTTLKAGTLGLAAVHAAGTGAITFAGKATLKMGNAALSSHHFSNPVDAFGNHDLVDLTGLHFHSGATATYHKASQHLTVQSGTKTDTLTLLSPHGTHFEATSDHHGGTGTSVILVGAKLKIENAALSHHVFENPTGDFGFIKHSVLDLSGLRFHLGRHRLQSTIDLYKV
jgi:autotransporter-associated beta strand protein